MFAYFVKNSYIFINNYLKRTVMEYFENEKKRLVLWRD